MLEDGAIFNGKCSMETSRKKESASEPEPAKNTKTEAK